MTADARTRTRILKALDRLKAARAREDERHDAAKKRLWNEAADLIEEGAKGGMTRGEFLDRPYSNRLLAIIYRERGLVQRPRIAAETSNRRPTKNARKG